MNRNLSVALGLIILGVVLYITSGNKDLAEQEKFKDFPWNITFTSDQKMEVLGITLGETNIEQAMKKFRTEYELGLYVKKDKQASLEAFYSGVKLAGLSAKVIVSLDISNQPWQQWQRNYVKAKGMPEKEIKYSLNTDDFRVARGLPIKTLSYIPAVSLDDDIVNNRFGMDYEKININETVNYLIYKEKGLAIRMDDDGKEILRYTHPSNLAEIRASIQQELDEEKAKAEES